jgi:chitodextrinase
MTAVTGTDTNTPVEYYFAETSGNAGGTDSGWQGSPVYTDTGLSPETTYTYTVQMRDALGNVGDPSPEAGATTDAAESDPPTPNPAAFDTPPTALSSSQITMSAQTGIDVSGPVEYYFDETSGNPGGSDSGWQIDSSYTDSGLDPETTYTYTVQMRDSWGNLTTVSNAAGATTEAISAALISDPFNYTLAQPLAGQNGGTGFSGPWSGGTEIVNGLTCPALSNESGNAMFMGTGSVSAVRPFSQAYSDHTWFLFIVDASMATADITGQRIQFESDGNTTGYGVHFDYSASSDRYTMYVRVGTSSTNAISITTSEPVLVIGHCVKGSTYSMQLWFNPSDLNLGTPSTSGSGIAQPGDGLKSSVFIRGDRGLVAFDEIRLANDYNELISN